MNNERTTNSVRNIIVGTVNRTVGIVFPFIVRTIFIKSLGEECLGLNGLYSSILQVLNIADLGIAGAIIASMYKPIAEKDTVKVSALMNLYKKAYRTIGFVILSVGIIITPFIDKFISGSPPANINIYALWMLYLLNTVTGYLFFMHKISLINAHQRNDITDGIATICRIIISILQIFIVAWLKNIYLYVILTIIYYIIYNFWCSYECDKRYPQYTCSGNLDKETSRKIRKEISALALQKIGKTVSNSLDSVVISAFLGLTVVAIYGNYNYIISAIAIFTQLIYAAIQSSIGNSIAVETKDKNYMDFNVLFFWGMWLVGWCSICFMCLFQDFMVLWMGEDLLFHISIVLTLVLRFFFEQIRKTVRTYKDTIGMWWVDKWKPVVGCLVNLFLNVVLVKKIGVAGVAISTIISCVCIELPWETHVLFKYYFQRSEIKYYIQMILYIFEAGVIGLMTFMICDILPFHGLWAIVVKLIICCLVPNILFVLINNRHPSYKKGIQMIKRVLKVKANKL